MRHDGRMHSLTLFRSLLAAAVLLCAAGCNRGTRGNDADSRPRAPGTADDPKNFGDTRAKAIEDGQSPSASPTGLSKDAKPGVPPPGAAGGATGNTNGSR